MLSYHSGAVLRYATKADWFLTIAASEFFVISLMSFLAAAESGVLFRDSKYPRLKSKIEVLMPLGPYTCIYIEKIRFLNIIRDCRFNRSKYYLSYVRSSEIDWDAVGMDSPFLSITLPQGLYFTCRLSTFEINCVQWMELGSRTLSTAFRNLVFVGIPDRK